MLAGGKVGCWLADKESYDGRVRPGNLTESECAWSSCATSHGTHTTNYTSVITQITLQCRIYQDILYIMKLVILTVIKMF